MKDFFTIFGLVVGGVVCAGLVFWVIDSRLWDIPDALEVLFFLLECGLFVAWFVTSYVENVIDRREKENRFLTGKGNMLIHEARG